MIWFFLLLAILFILFLVMAVARDSEFKVFTGFLFILTILVFISVGLDLRDRYWGMPKTQLDVGEYKVGFVYVAGLNVTIGIELHNDNKGGENLVVYQFKKKYFDSGHFNPAGHSLIVEEADGFKKLALVE